MAKTTLKYSKFGETAGIFGLFKTTKAKVCVGVLDGSPLDKPIPVLVNYKAPISCTIPSGLSDDDVNMVSTILNDILKAESYPDYKFKMGIVQIIVEDVDFSKHELDGFVERRMTPSVADADEVYYRNLLAEQYGEVEKSFNEMKNERDASKSLKHKPFEDLVKTYSSQPEINFALSKREEALLEGIKNGVDRFVLLQGYPGTGKTSAAKGIAMRLGLPFRQSVGSFDNTDQLIGCYSVTVDDDKEKVEFLQGPLLECYEHGGVYIMDEANFTRPDVMAVIQGMTDSTGYYTEKTTKRMIKRHDNFVLIFTINPKAKGSYPLNEALLNRFTTVIDYEKETKLSIYKKLLDRYQGAVKVELLDHLAGVPNQVEAWAKVMNSHAFCSIRQVMNFIDAVYSKELTDKEFESEFVTRVVSPVCSANIFNVNKINELRKKDEYKNNIAKAFSLYSDECKAVARPDLAWACCLDSQSASSSSDWDMGIDDISSSMDDFAKQFNGEV